MRIVSRAFATAGLVLLAFTLPAAAQGDDFMSACMVTASQKMCSCMEARIPANQRASAVDGLRKSNASVSVSGNLLDPATLDQTQMQGLNAVVAAQAYCM
jgi:predicted Zn-dependent protease